MKTVQHSLLSIAACLLFASPHGAASPFKIADETGWSGYVFLGANSSNISSNLIASGSSSSDDGAFIEDLTSEPDSRHNVSPAYGLDLRYTFKPGKAQAFLGTLIQDAVRLDFQQHAGIRLQTSKHASTSLSYVFSGAPRRVWEDPYLTGQDRDDVKRQHSGVRLAWQSTHFFGPLVNYSYQTIDVDDERSGFALRDANVLSQQEVESLDRNGHAHYFSAGYRLPINRQHSLIPELNFRRWDLDGEAVSNDRFGVQLTYRFSRDQHTVISNFAWGRTSYDARNPVFNERTNGQEWLVNAQWFRKNWFGIDPLSSLIALSYGNSEADVAFNDIELFSARVGALYRF